MVDLTVIILTRNEELHIEKCIKSFKGIAKRFVIVDSNSTDNTKDLCIQMGTDFYEHEFINYTEQFNWALENTDISTSWVMRMDADEELTEELTVEIEEKLETLKEGINGVVLKRRLHFLGRWIRHGGLYPSYLLRIFRRGTAIIENKIMDQHTILLNGKSVLFDQDIIDNNRKGLEYWLIKHNWYSNMELKDYFNLKENPATEEEVKADLFGEQVERVRWLKSKFYYKLPKLRRAKWYFLYRYIFKLGFLDGKEGRIYHFLQGYWYRFYIDAKIFECEKMKKSYKAGGAL